MFTSPVGQVPSVARYFDLSADERRDVIEVQRLTADVHDALAHGTPGFLRTVAIATETFELVVNDLYRANTARTSGVARISFLVV